MDQVLHLPLLLFPRVILHLVQHPFFTLHAHIINPSFYCAHRSNYFGRPGAAADDEGLRASGEGGYVLFGDVAEKLVQVRGYGIEGFLFQALDFFLYALLSFLLERGHLCVEALVEEFKEGILQFLANFREDSIFVVRGTINVVIFGFLEDASAHGAKLAFFHVASVTFDLQFFNLVPDKVDGFYLELVAPEVCN